MYSDIRYIGELSKDGVFIYNVELQKFIYVNTPFADIFSLTADGLLKDSKAILNFVRTEDTYYLRRCFIELQQKGSINSTEFRAYFADEAVTHIRCDAFVMEDANTIAGFVRNITKEKQHEDYIINYGARKDTLLDMMTHNLSGPLSLSKNVLRWVQETYKDNTPGAISSQLQIIQASTQECLDIVNDFLKEEHLESERVYVKKTRFDVLQRIVTTLDKLIATNKNKKFRLITQLQNVNINTDSVKFFQIIHNLVSNAIKFTREGGAIDILVDEKEASFVFGVKDNGIGIPLSLQASLFDKRTSSGRNGLNNELSTGLGLSIVKALTELIGGKVWFESEENKGAAFFIELPKE